MADPILKLALYQRFPQFFKKPKIRKKIGKNLLPPRFEPGSLNPKSGMLASRPRIHENCLKISKISDQVF